jgi:hypothetical protein
MSTKLKFGTSVEIVHATLQDLFPQRYISVEHMVGEIVSDEADLQALQGSLEERLRAISIPLKIPRIQPDLTIRRIGWNISHWSATPGILPIAWSTLPGKPVTTNPGPKPPPAGPVPDDIQDIDLETTLWSTLPGDPGTPDPGHQPPPPGPVPDKPQTADPQEENPRREPQKHREKQS